MATITLRICDRCDCRDPADGPAVPRNGIIHVILTVQVDKGPPMLIEKDLCGKCRDNLDSMLKIATYPMASAASEPECNA